VAAARTVTQWELPAFAWVEIVDTQRVKYLYLKRAAAPAGATVHIEPVFPDPGQNAEPRLRLARKDGLPVLRQEPPGLPARIVVQLNDQGRLVAYEYELAQPNS
jgi:hypothetical protein